MDEQVQLIGSNWFSTAQGQEMADMVETGALDLLPGGQAFPLPGQRPRSPAAQGPRGGFSNYIVVP